MPTSRPFAYNTGPTILGTSQFGNLAVGTPTSGVTGSPKWWNGPDEELGYVIAESVSGNTQPTPVSGVSASVGFFRSTGLTESSFIELAEIISQNQTFSTGDDAYLWLSGNGYWASWNYTASTIVTDSLFMELDASNYVSGTWTDETGNGNNATINGATWLSTDGGIFDLDGSNDNISIAHNSSLSLNTTTQKTIQVWVKFDALPALNVQIPVFGKLSSSFNFDGYWGGLFSNGGTVRCVTNGTSIQRVSTSTSTITTNTWYLFTFISRITSISNTTKVYINETEYITAAHGTDSYSEANPLYLGYIGAGVGSNYLNGKIGACYFYTKGLSVAEISQNYNATKSKYGL